MGDSARENSSLPVKSARDFFSSTHGKYGENPKKMLLNIFFNREENRKDEKK